MLTYDYVIQAGHEGRTTGATGAAANGLIEKDLTPRIATVCAQALSKAGYNVLYQKADNLKTVACKVAVAVHFDGNPNSGAMIGYENKTDYPTALRWKEEWSRYWDKWSKDNLTVGLSKYYGYKYWVTSEAQFVIEVASIGDSKQADIIKQNKTAFCDYVGKLLAHVVSNYETDHPGTPYWLESSNDWQDHMFADSIAKAIKDGVLTADKDGNFYPNGQVTRGMLAAVLDRTGAF